MAPFDPCEPCCDPPAGSRSVDGYRASVLIVLCQILAAVGGGGGEGGVDRYDWEVLCDPDTGAAVLLRFEYQTDGTVIGVEGFNPDGTAYAGALNALVACGGSAGLEGVYAEDSLFQDEDLGRFVFGVRKDMPTSTAGSPATVTSSDSDYSQLTVNQFGALVIDVNTVARGNLTNSPFKEWGDTTTAGGNHPTSGALGMAVLDDVINSPLGVVTAAAPLHQTIRGALHVYLSGGVTDESVAAAQRGLVRFFSSTFLAAQNVGTMPITVQQDTPAAGLPPDGAAYRAIKSNDFGGVYVDTADREADFLSGTLAFGGVTTAFATLVTNGSNVKGRGVIVLNQLDRDVALSFDGVNDQWFVVQGGSTHIDLSANGRWATTDLEVRALGSNPTAGDVFASVLV